MTLFTRFTQCCMTVLCLVCIFIILPTLYKKNNQIGIKGKPRRIQCFGIETNVKDTEFRVKHTARVNNIEAWITDTTVDRETTSRINTGAGTRNTDPKVTVTAYDLDTDCNEKEIKLSEIPLPMTGLVSFPGSGNTWTRHLIQQMTGVGTSSMYCNKKLEVGGFPYECHADKRRTIVVKAHRAARHPFKKIILLLRNPYEAFLSGSLFQFAGHKQQPSKKHLQIIRDETRVFSYFVEWYLNLTRMTTEEFKGPVHILQYENLKSDLAGELKKVAIFLEANVSARDIDCTVRLQEGNFHRATPPAQHLDQLHAIFSKEKLLRLQDVVRDTEMLLKDAYNINIDVGGAIEDILLKNL